MREGMDNDLRFHLPEGVAEKAVIACFTEVAPSLLQRVIVQQHHELERLRAEVAARVEAAERQGLDRAHEAVQALGMGPRLKERHVIWDAMAAITKLIGEDAARRELARAAATQGGE